MGAEDRITSITDQPIQNLESDLLEVEKYAAALCSFILESDTPLTIGMQGEWGTGKTSLMYLLKEMLEKSSTAGEYAIATSWVNTWEYSMFKGTEQTTPAVLKGMLEKLKESCGDNWTLTDDVKNKIDKVGNFLGNVANQLVASKTGVDVKAASAQQTEKILADIADIKADIKDVIADLINDEKNPYKKVVFFIDDLDRIEPSDAVEVLESLKNIFDIDKCIFILAIDYDIVVKGLEKKFGKKTDQNEREFRSFFDKIIQVPFSMPTGAYNIENFLHNKLTKLGIEIEANLLPKYVEVVSHTVGFNPRSLKRYLNTFSLLRKIKDMDDETEIDQDDDFVLFNLIGIQVSYPRIFRLFNQFPEYEDWDESVAAKLDLNLKELADASKKYGEDADEIWEQIIFGISQSDPYLKVKWIEVVKMLDKLRSHFKKKELLYEKIHGAMEFASMTSVDDAVEGKHNKKFTVGNFGNYDEWLKQRVDNDSGISEQAIQVNKNIYTSISEEYDGQVDFKFRKEQVTVLHNGKKVLNINLGKKYGGTSLFLLRDEEKGFRFPDIKQECKNLRNDSRGCEYYAITNIESLDEEIKNLIRTSFEIRQNNKPLLKTDHPQLDDILANG